MAGKRIVPRLREFRRCLSQKPTTTTSPFSTATQPSLEENPVWKTLFSQPLKGLPRPVYAKRPSHDPFMAEITTLPSGLKVASEQHFGDYCTIGVLIDAGSRYEVAYPNGVCHFLEKLAFNSTCNHDSHEALHGVLEKAGGICDAQFTKDTFIYASSCHVSGVDDVLGILSDTVLRPRITPQELEKARETVKFEIEDLNMKPEPEPILTDLIHAAAYRDNTLGLPKYCPPENFEDINQEILFSFLKTHYIPKRTVVAGVGVSHDQLVEATRKHFENIPPIWTTDSGLVLPHCPPVDESLAQYTGGLVTMEKDLGGFPMDFPELAHLVLGLQSCSYRDPDFVAFCVLNLLLGGGGSFSAGGPGKGMYTRLYVDVLNQHHWMYNATSYNHVYGDSGLFCIQASGPPNQLGELTEIIVNQYLRLMQDVGQEELDRSKTQLKSMLMMNLEQRPVMFEDLGRQVLGHGHRKSPMDYIEEIEAVTAADIKRIVERMLSSKVSLVGYGSLKKMLDYDKVDAAIGKRSLKELTRRRFTIFT